MTGLRCTRAPTPWMRVTWPPPTWPPTALPTLADVTSWWTLRQRLATDATTAEAGDSGAARPSKAGRDLSVIDPVLTLDRCPTRDGSSVALRKQPQSWPPPAPSPQKMILDSVIMWYRRLYLISYWQIFCPSLIKLIVIVKCELWRPGPLKNFL